jgi:hypothetical protein
MFSSFSSSGGRSQVLSVTILTVITLLLDNIIGCDDAIQQAVYRTDEGLAIGVLLRI